MAPTLLVESCLFQGVGGRLITGDPYFTPGTPLVLESKGIGDFTPGDLAVVRTGRGRARVEQILGPATRIENVLEGLLVESGSRQPFEPHQAPEPALDGRVDLRDLLTYTIDPDTAKDFDDALSFREEPEGIRARVNTWLRQSLATLAREQVFVAVAVDVPRADQPLELFRLQLLAGDLPLQFSDHLLHAARSPESARLARSLARAGL